MQVGDIVYGVLVCIVAWLVSGCTATIRFDTNSDESKVVSYREPVASAGSSRRVSRSWEK